MAGSRRVAGDGMARSTIGRGLKDLAGDPTLPAGSGAPLAGAARR